MKTTWHAHAIMILRCQWLFDFGGDERVANNSEGSRKPNSQGCLNLLDAVDNGGGEGVTRRKASTLVVHSNVIYLHSQH